MYKVIATVKSVKGECAAKHRVGDKFVIDATTPKGMCASAYYAIFPAARVLRFGGVLPWEKNKGLAHIACPDPDNPVVFELRRIRR
ncbi:MAG: TIGR04076 family protein [Candidatus Edwardsbacteria bacterium]